MIIALKDKDRVYLACSIGEMMFNSSKDDLVDLDNLTMWKVKNTSNCYIACGNLCLETDILRYTQDLLPKEINDETINKALIPNIKDLFKGLDMASSNKWKNDLIVVIDEDIYAIDRYFCVIKIQNFCAIGYGQDVVTAALENTQGNNPYSRLINCFNTLDNMKMCKSFPFVIIDTKTNKKKIINNYTDIKKLQNYCKTNVGVI